MGGRLTRLEKGNIIPGRTGTETGIETDKGKDNGFWTREGGVPVGKEKAGCIT